MKEPNITDYLDCLHKIIPPTGIAYVGTGIGIAQQWPNWNIPYNLLINVEADCHECLREKSDLTESFIFSEIVSDIEAETVFYITSNPQLNGLIPTEKLNSLWPDVTTVATRTIKSTTLSNILNGLPNDIASQINWLVIDCLPALNILKGATNDYFDQISVILLRVILDDTIEALADCNLPVTNQFLTEKGYQHLTTDSDEIPSAGWALFYKNGLTHKLETLSLKYIDIQILAESRLQEIQTTQQTLKDKNNKITQLELELHEMAGRQQQLNKEMLKVEAQIELLKDIFTRN